MNIAIVQFPGSNCERETALAIQRAGMNPVEFLWNESPAKLNDMDGYVIIGGFSYEDRSRAGIIAALDPVMGEIKKQSELGKPVLGLCNGAQILVETGLVPGLKNFKLGMALTENKRIVDGTVLGTGFYNAWINLRVNPQAKINAFTRHLGPESVLSVPTAHAQGRFIMPAELLAEVEQEGLNVFQYCDEQGLVDDNFPTNPNGSLANTAAVVNKAGNVMAMMPHPERSSAGDALFLSMHDYIKDVKKPEHRYLDYVPKPIQTVPYKKEIRKQELLIQLIITDNSALTVQNALRKLGILVKVSRMVHWQIDCNNQETLEKIKKSGVLFNERKEFLVPPFDLNGTKEQGFLVRPKENLLGLQKQQTLSNHFSIEGIESIEHGILWVFSSDESNIAGLVTPILNTHIIFNPYAHECYDYE